MRITITAATLPRLAFGLSFVILTFGLAVVGPRYGLDSQTYIPAGEKLWEWIFSETHDPSALGPRNMYPYYVITFLVIGGIFKLAGPVASYVFIFLNIFLFSLLSSLVFRNWLLFDGSLDGKWFLCFGLFLLFGFVDVPLWNYYILSDVLFLFSTSLFWYMLLNGIVNRAFKYWGFALLVALISVFIRPTGLVLPLFWFLAVSYTVINERRDGLVFVSTILVLTFFAGVLLVVPGAVMAFHRDSEWMRQLLPDQLVGYLQLADHYYQKGVVVSDRYETYLPSPTDYFDYVKITLHRFFYFFYPLREGYSWLHNSLNAGYTVILVVFAFFGWKRLASLGNRYRSLAMLLVFFSLFFGLFHAITFNSYGWRYQLPAMVPVWLLAGYGFILSPRGKRREKNQKAPPSSASPLDMDQAHRS